VTVFFVRKSIVQSRRKEPGKGRSYSATMFRAIRKSDTEMLDDDKVQILSTS